MYKIVFFGIVLLCFLQIIIAQDEANEGKEDCFDETKINEMKAKWNSTRNECKEANPDNKDAFKECMKEKKKERKNSRKNKSFDEIVAERMDLVLPEKQQQVEEAAKACSEEAGDGENKTKKALKCWRQKLSQFCKMPKGGRGKGRGKNGKGGKKKGGKRKGSSEESGSGETTQDPVIPS